MVSNAFEQAMGYVPFLQDSVASNRYYDPPGTKPNNRSASGAAFGGGRILNLNAALASASAIVSVTASGKTMVLGTDYFLKPQNAPSNKRPYNRIDFVGPIWGVANSIVVNAQWGVQQTISEDVWQGLLRIGASIIARDVLEGIRTGTLDIKQGDEEFRIDPKLITDMGASWERESNRMLAPYKFIQVGIP